MFSWGQSRYKGWEATGYESRFNPGSWYIALTDPDGNVYDDVRIPAFTKRRAAKKRIRNIQRLNKKNSKAKKDEGVIRF